MICIGADDFGLHAGINLAVQRLAGLGRVQAVSAMVGAPAWRSGVPLLRRLDAEGIDVGLHLDLTEAPLLRASMRPLPSLIVAAYARRLDRSVLNHEIHVQLDHFEAALGQAPAFVDGHQHVHQLPGVRDELIAELQDRYGAARPWLRSTRPGVRWPLFGAARLGAAKASVIAALGAAGLNALARRHGFSQNGRLLGVYDFHGGTPRYEQLLAAWLDAAHDGDLLVSHPGLELSQEDALGTAREAEYAMLASPAFDRMIDERGITLWPMSRILARAAA
jgi:predicted glycoside hydrolase/deacetylase ChbG (UPF0249 family)